jgi:putative ABC transport system permease protein
MNNLLSDIRIALRGFRRSPAFAATVLIILGVGIGSAVAMFTVFRAVLIEKLPVRDAERLVVLSTYKSDPSVEFGLQLQDLKSISSATNTMRGIAGFAHWGVAPSPMLDGDRTLTLNRVMASTNFFDVLGAVPFMGRLFRPTDGDLGAAQIMVISYNTWRHTFAGDSGIVGRRVTEPYSHSAVTIVGVAPAGLDYPARADFWLPERRDAGGQSIIAVARLAPGATPAAARTELFGIMQRTAPEKQLGGANVVDFTRAVIGDVRPILRILTLAVALLLLIACVNVGNLLLLRAAGRTREIAVRRALGASYGALVRQLLTENALLAVGCGALGFLCAEALLRILVAFAPPQLPRTDMIALAGAPIAAALGATFATMLFFGVVPALLAARTNVATTLRLDSRAGGDSSSRRRVRHLLVATQTTLALIMLVGGVLLARSLAHLEALDLGYNADRLSFLSVTWPAAKIAGGPKLFPTGEDLMRRWRAIPGIVAITPTMAQPLVGANIFLGRMDHEGQSASERAANPIITVELGGEDYFRTFGIPIKRGRGFRDTDREDAPHVAVVSEAVARRAWPGENPIGKRIHFWEAEADSATWRTVVGVVGETHLRTLRDATPEIYIAWRQSPYWQNMFAIRTTGALATVLPAIRREVHDASPELSLWYTEPMRSLLNAPLAQPRMITILMSAFGMAALLLAAMGLYGLMASIVRDGTREIGIRMALGATPERVRRSVLRQALITCGIGALVGIAGALALSRLLASQLYEVSPSDPVALVGACAILLAVALIAAYLPARRATRIDPAQALRAD